ncbi:hypothetical protein [Sporosarcina sp. NCCP-2222]|uniref:hypothetical protein n=1 Tax=Sporosarcina sp. NCCP-2222 TaxID=2935073 RepID=UPI0020BE1EC8|nr:hypothetical protein [Sporosarcina sp. NCCP-2222]
MIVEGDTSGSLGHTSGSRLIRVVALDIRAVVDLYEWFLETYEWLPADTSGSPGYMSGCRFIRVVARDIRAVVG